MSSSDSLSPLVAIRDKERSLAQEIRSAQERADAKVAQAHAQADSIKQQAERQGVQEAEALYQQGLAQAREQAQVVSQDGEAEAGKSRQAGLGRVGKAVNHILQFVLPHTQ